MRKPTLTQISGAFDRLGYRMFDGVDPQGNRRDLDLNIFGVRSSSKRPDSFDDWIGVFWFDTGKGDWQYHVWPATTDPGLYWLKQPEVVAGTAVLVEGQYRSSHRIGLHKGSYVALVQNMPVRVYRDGNLDDIIDEVPELIQVGNFGINIHRASKFSTSTTVGMWSAGCQVLADPGDFALLMDICQEAAKIWMPVFSYSLFSEAQLTKPAG